MIGKVIQNKICINVKSIKNIDQIKQYFKQRGHSDKFISNMKLQCFDNKTYITLPINKGER